MDSIALLKKLLNMEKRYSTKELDIAIIGYQLCSDDYYATEHGLSVEQVDTLAQLIYQVSVSVTADPRYSAYDYADALIHACIAFDPIKLLTLANANFEQFETLMCVLAGKKRAVYEGREFAHEGLLKLLVQEYGVGG